MSISEGSPAPHEVERTVSGRSFVAQIIYLILTVIVALLGIRFILSLLEAIH